MYLLIDECCGKALVSISHRLGHTAQRTREIGELGSGADDRRIFEFARRNGAVFVTINRTDYVALAAYGRPHPGAISSRRSPVANWRVCFGESCRLRNVCSEAVRVCLWRSMRASG
jgi:predicted nuclease of predicted toxin-antitoxin system